MVCMAITAIGIRVAFLALASTAVVTIIDTDMGLLKASHRGVTFGQDDYTGRIRTGFLRIDRA